MNSRERFLTALQGEQPDRIPCYDFMFSVDLFRHFIKNASDNYTYNVEDAAKVADELGLDGMWVPFGGLVDNYAKVLSDKQYIDEWGTTYQKEKASWPIDAPIAYPISARVDLESYTPPSPDSGDRLAQARRAIELNTSNRAILGGLNGPLTTATFLMGLENICINFYEDPDLLEDIFRLSNAFWIPAGKKLVELGVDVIIFGEDLGYDSNLFASPAHLRKHLFPYIEELVRTFSDKGIPVIMHSDGKLHDVMDDLVGFGISGFHPSERKAGMDLRWAKERYGNKLCLFGNVDSSKTLPYGSLDDVEEEVIECIKAAAKGGGYIIGSDHSLHDGIPIENMIRLFSAAREHGQYPLTV